MKNILYILFLFASIGLTAQQPKSAKVIVGTDAAPDPTVNITSSVTDNVTETSFRVSWSVSPNATGQIEFYKTDTPATLYYTNLAAGYDPNHIQTVGQQLGGSNYNGTQLTAGTNYTYRVIGESEFDGAYASDWATVTTTADLPNLTVTASDATASEPSNDGEFTITSDVSASGDLVVAYAISGSATAGTDYTSLSGTATILNGQTTVVIPVETLDDSDVEGTETVSITVTSSATYNAGSPNSATVTISDDDGGGGDPEATIVATDGTATEAGTTTGEFTVTLDAPSSGTTTINYTVSGTATAGSDYTALSGTVDITDGNTSATITVAPLNDTDVESSEVIIVDLSNGSGYTIGNPNSASVTIISDDSGGGSVLASVTTTDAIANETGSDNGVFTIALSEPNPGSTITVNYHMDGLATEGSDYTSLSGTVAFANGEQTKTVTVARIDDSIIEPDETVMLIIDSGSGYSTEGFERAILEIIDNDNTSSSYPTPSGTVNITNLSDFTNASNAGKTATITGSFSASSATAAANMVLVAGGGVISGGNINLNGSGISPSNGGQIFSSNASFSSIYDKSRISINVFGATSGDSSDDNSAIVTAINNAQHLTATLNGQYIKNNPTNFTRSGLVDWDMNGATISTTSASNFNTGAFSVDEVFNITNLQPFIYNGTFDMTDTYGRVFELNSYTKFSFKNLVIENLYNPVPIRSYAIRLGGASSTEYGEYIGNTFRNIRANGDGAANNSDGISKAIWSSSGNLSNASFEIVHSGNTYHDIRGDDAEAIYYISSGDRIHNGHVLFDNETGYRVTRRIMKMCQGQFTVQNCDFTEQPSSIYVSALSASMVDIFSTTSADIRNIKVVNSSLKTASGEQIKKWLNSYTDAQDILVKGNTYNVGSPYGLGAIRLGSNTSAYDGTLRNMTIKDNNLINGSIEWMQNYDGSTASPTIIDNNTFTYNSVAGASAAPLDFYHVGGDLKGYADFTNNNIIFNVNGGGYDGIISSSGSGVNITDLFVDNNTLTFNSSASTYEIGYVLGGLTNSVFSNNTIVGGSGNITLRIDGSQTGTTQSGNTPAITID